MASSTKLKTISWNLRKTYDKLFQTIGSSAYFTPSVTYWKNYNKLLQLCFNYNFVPSQGSVSPHERPLPFLFSGSLLYSADKIINFVNY